MLLQRPIRVSAVTALVIAFTILFVTQRPALVLASSDGANKAQTKFERDLESLFGAAITTKHGTMKLRQNKDRNGLVRKQILTAPSFSEIQLDQNGDGTVDFWEITQDTKTVSASNPFRGRFLRMNVTERSTDGKFEAFYVLDRDGRRYNLVRTKYDRADRKLFSESVPDSFDATDLPSAPSASPTDGSSRTSIPTSSDRIDLEDESWREYQSKTWGPDLLCVSDSSTSGRLASIQREWWKILKRDADGRADRLAEKIKSGGMFDESCKKPGREKDFEKIAKSLSELMMTSSKGVASESRQAGGYLRCLEQSGLGVIAARIEQNFAGGLDNPRRAAKLISCDYKPGAAGLAKPAYANHTLQQVVMHMCVADEATGKAKTADGSTQNYKNVLFHELIHVAGVESEAMTHAAQACCGDPTTDRTAACGKLDKIVAEERRFTELEAFLARDEKMVPILAELNAKFDAKGTADLYRQFLLGLDKTGLISNEEFSKCLKTASETECREKWVVEIEKHANGFFSKDCKKIVVGASRSQCSKMSSEFKKRLATTIAHSMIQLKSDVEPGEGGQCSIQNLPSRTGSRTAKILHDLIRKIPLLASANAVEEDCNATGIVIPPAPPLDMVIKSPTFSVPGAGDSDAVASRPGGDDSVVVRPREPATPIRDSDRSPLPVTNVTSPGSGRTVAERSYQRATDFAGLATRGLSDLKDSLVPRAIAAERSGDKASRLDGDEAFIAFRPTKSGLKAIKVDNPFAENRSIASLVQSSDGAAGSVATSKSGNLAVDPGAPVSKSSSPGADAAGKAIVPGGPQAAAALGGHAAKAKGDNIIKTSDSANGATSATADPKVDNGNLKTPEREPAKAASLLEGLFTQKYKFIEARLNDLKLQQLLIDRGIKVIGADGRMFGAKRTFKTCYKYVGQDSPLKSPCEN